MINKFILWNYDGIHLSNGTQTQRQILLWCTISEGREPRRFGNKIFFIIKHNQGYDQN